MAEIQSLPWVRIVCALLGIALAIYKGRRVFIWALITYFSGPLGLIVLLCMSKLERIEFGSVKFIRRRWASRAIEKKFEGLGTTQDFLTEIENEKKKEEK